MNIWPFGRKKPDIKASYSGEISTEAAIKLISEELGRMVGGRSGAGQLVNEQTAMQFSAVYACVSLLSGTIASLSCEVFKRVGEDERELAPDHPAFPLLHDEPNPTMSAYVFWETEGADCYLAGNAYAIIARKKSGRPVGLYWAPSSRVTPKLSPDYSRILYQITFDGRQTKTFDQDDILHFPCIGWDGLKGRSPIADARESIGLGLAGEQFNAKYFSNAITADVSISFDKPMKEDAMKQFRESLQKRYGNTEGSSNMRLPLVLTDGAKVTSLRMNADDAQMMLSRHFQIEDICRFYGVPLHLVSSTEKSTSWGTGIEEQTIGFVKFVLRRRLKMMEQEVNRKLIDDPKYFCKFNMDDILRGDIKTRAEFYKVALGGNQVPGFMTPNEIRKLENRRPLEGEKYNKPYDPAEANKGAPDAGQPDAE
jgi:HK97 family phage portal protein